MNQEQKSRHTHWVFTLQVDEKDDTKLVIHPKMRYLIYQREIAPNTGQHHFQGYFQMQRPTSFKSIKKILPKAHIEIAKGTSDQARAYCKKDDTRAPGHLPVEQGEYKAQGSRTDISAFTDFGSDLKNSEYDIITKYPIQYIKYNKGLKAMRNIIRRHQAKAFRKVSVKVYYGPTGTGKSYRAREKFDFDESRYYVPDLSTDTLWYDGYEGQEGLILDDFGGLKKPSICNLLRILDPYSITIPVKGGFTMGQWTTVIITSNQHPSDWYTNATQAHQAALLRRCHRIIHFANNRGPFRPKQATDLCTIGYSSGSDEEKDSSSETSTILGSRVIEIE